MQSRIRVFSTTVTLPSGLKIIGDQPANLFRVLIGDLLRNGVQTLQASVVALKGLVDVVLREIDFLVNYLHPCLRFLILP
jgi:hypothetical protein